MKKITRALCLELLLVKKEAQEISKSAPHTKEALDAHGKVFEKDVEVLHHVDGKMGHFICDIAEGFARADVSPSRFLKCLEVCGIEVVE